MNPSCSAWVPKECIAGPGGPFYESPRLGSMRGFLMWDRIGDRWWNLGRDRHKSVASVVAGASAELCKYISSSSSSY